MRCNPKVLSMFVAGLFAVASARPGLSQDASTGTGGASTGANGSTRAGDRDDGPDLGWIGLAGLLGLAGLAGRNRAARQDGGHH
jgi:hypothetical protein